MPISTPSRFAAIDFETADYGRDSACSVAIVTVENGTIVSRWQHLIKPPRRKFDFTYLHGIGWRDVENQPTFGELWPEFQAQLANLQFLVAHNAGFDKAVLNACCVQAKIKPQTLPFKCTVQLARTTWDIFPTKLPNVCQFLKIPLEHHKAESDAEACAQIMLAAMAAVAAPTVR
ncbi:MAG: 3'-5' exonuclease [Planctomycetes bacterium]|nr:3'-5' exonuclease [Planctomycetota bacterium]